MESKYDHHEFLHHKKPTNADRIRTMDNKRLAEFLNHVETEGRYGFLRGKSGWLDWLQQEAENGNSD